MLKDGLTEQDVQMENECESGIGSTSVITIPQSKW